MLVVIVGAGSVGRRLAEISQRDKNDVIVIEKNPAVADLTAKQLGVKVIQGDGDDPNVLEEAGIRGADAFVAVTGEDEDNLVACTLAKFQYQVKRVLARVNDPKHEWMFGKDMGVDIAVDESALIARLLESEMAVSDIVALLRLREGEVTLVEKVVTAGSKPAGLQIRELGLPEDAVCVAVLRGGKILVPSGDLTLQAEDQVLVLTTTDQEARAAEALG